MSTRSITDHRLNGLNESIGVVATDTPGPGGANHVYAIGYRREYQLAQLEIHFQNGPLLEAGPNGISNEALLAVVIDRMRGFQHQRKPDGEFDYNSRGQFACRENAVALTHLEDALMWLQKRTRDRLARGVEGTHKV